MHLRNPEKGTKLDLFVNLFMWHWLTNNGEVNSRKKKSQQRNIRRRCVCKMDSTTNATNKNDNDHMFFNFIV